MSANQDSLMSARANLILAAARPLAGAAFLGLTLSPALSVSPATAAPIVGVPAALPEHPQNSLLQPVAVFGRDARRPVPQSLAPVAAKIGVLHDPRSHSVCTTFCVAPDIVATAAHCLYRTGDEPAVHLSDVTVRLHGGRVTSRIAGADKRGTAPNVLAGSTRLNVQPPIDAPRDWALVRLAQPLCKGRSLPLSRRSVEDVMRLARAGRVYNIAYHRDLPKWQPMLARPCRVRRSFTEAAWSTIGKDFSDPDQLLLHTCDTGAGSSGSPLLVDGPHGPEVVGINVGTYVQSKVIMLNGKVVHRFKSDDVANTGVNSLAFSAALDAFISADMLASRRDIRRLQEALAARALYEGPRDGRFGPALTTAIEIFERASGMPVTGLATRTLLATLLGESQVVTGKVAKPRESVTTRLRR
jgi:Trypsin-like peptidase domain/Putative peptidoglycan binding domain